MKTSYYEYRAGTALACATLLLLTACSQKQETTTATTRPATMQVEVPLTTSSDEARALYIEGRAMLDDLRFTDSHAKFLQAVEADPDFAMAHVLAANTALSAEEFFVHVGHAQESAANASEGEQLYVQALVAASENDQAAQGAALAKLVSAYPKDPRTHMVLGNFHNGQQDFEGAVMHFTHATELAPEFAPAFNSLGYAYRSLDDLDQAKVAFEQYVALIPNEANPHDSYAELLMEMGNHEESIKHYQMALDIDPHFLASYAGISTNHSLMDQPGKSQETAQKMISAARNFAERQNGMFQSVRSHLFAGETDPALQVCSKMIAEADEQRDAAAAGGVYEYMGDILLHAEQAAEAEEHYDLALSSRQKSNINEANKAQAGRNHMFKTAIAAIVAENGETAAEKAAMYSAAVAEHGTKFEKLRAHELAGYVAMMNDDMEAAAAHLAQASQFNPNVLYWQAMAQEALGEKDKARDLATRAAKRNILSPQLPFVRADALMYLEKLDQT